MDGILNGKEIYMSNKTKVAELIAKAHDTQIHQNDALLLIRAAVILHKMCLQKQAPFTGHFASQSNMTSVRNELQSIIRVVLQGPCILNEGEDPKMGE